MTEHKFTDEEVIKAFENCYGITEGSCKECPMYDSKRDKCKVGGESVCLESLVYDLIKRQKAEIEALEDTLCGKLSASAAAIIAEMKGEEQ